MKIDLNLSDRALRKRIAEIEAKLPGEIDVALAQTAYYGSNIMADRSKEGRGLLGAFKPYTPKYAIFRRDHGRGNVVDLNYTGQMWSSLTTFKRRGYAEIKFSNALANRKAYFNNQRRPFFGFREAEKVKLLEFMKKRLFE